MQDENEPTQLSETEAFEQWRQGLPEVAQLAVELHRRCLAHWETLDPEKAKGTTFHAADAHLDEARRIIAQRE